MVYFATFAATRQQGQLTYRPPMPRQPCVATDLDLAARNRPAAFQDQLPPEREAEIDRLSRHRYDRHQAEGISPAAVASVVVDGIRDERFYLLTHAEPILSRVRLRMEAILAGANPPPIP